MVNYKTYCLYFLGKTGRQVDIAFVVGAKGLGAEKIFDYEKNIVKSIIDLEEPSKTRYGLITYSNKAQTQIRFGDFLEKTNVKRMIDFIGWQSDGVVLHDAMEKTLELFKNTSPVHARKVAFIFVNQRTGVSLTELAAKSQKLRQNGIDVVVIASGSKADEREIKSIAPDGNIIRGPDSQEDVKPVVDETRSILGNDPCLAIDCPYHGICVLNEERLPSCVCPNSYPSTYEPVCGSDLMTYRNLDALKMAACQMQQDLTPRSSGKCGMCPKHLFYGVRTKRKCR